jgi:Leucine-rich repeat (LRR) protein
MQKSKKKEIYNALLEAYSEANLTILSSQIINNYKRKRYAYLHEINQVIHDYEADKKEKTSKIFSKLIMRFHPDKCTYYKNEIEHCFQNGGDRLHELSKIFSILDLDEQTAGTNLADDDFAFEAEYVWDFDESGFSYFTEDEDQLFDFKTESNNPDPNERITFLSALKRREYGNTNIDFPVHQLYDYEQLELAEYEIEDLEGIEFCRHLLSLDLSGNLITDITRLATLKSLEELYLANNQLNFIDRIYPLKKLKVLDISNNELEDISTLYHLNNLEYVNLVGNNIPKHQVEHLKELGVIVIS